MVPLRSLFALVLLPAALVSSAALAQSEAGPTVEPGLAGEVVASGPFDYDFGFSAYYSGWAGSYDAGGVGFRIRWEPLPYFGVEFYSELLDVSVPVGSRINLPNGFNLYMPFEVMPGFRVRPMLGLCSMFVFNSAGSDGGVDSEDVQFGVHGGVGGELALHDRLSVFVDVLYQGYWGHGHDAGSWTSSLEDDLRRHDSLQVGLGLQFHL